MIDASLIIVFGTVCGVVLGWLTGVAALEVMSSEFGGDLQPAAALASLGAVVAWIASGSVVACLLAAWFAIRNGAADSRAMI
jgi:hypothetical protein